MATSAKVSPQHFRDLLSSFIHHVPATASPESQTSHGRCSSRHHQGFLNRVKTFTTLTWFAKPGWLSPPNCARYGWENVGPDMLRCVGCKALISGRLPPTYEPRVYDECCKKLENNLRNAHNICCSWANNPSPVSFLTVELSGHEAEKAQYVDRVKKFLALGQKLPEVTPDLLMELGIESSMLRRLKLLINEDAAQDTEEDTALTSACLLALCGWKNLQESFKSEEASCEMCFRNLGLWNYKSPARPDQSPEESEEEEVLGPETGGDGGLETGAGGDGGGGSILDQAERVDIGGSIGEGEDVNSEKEKDSTSMDEAQMSEQVTEGKMHETPDETQPSDGATDRQMKEVEEKMEDDSRDSVNSNPKEVQNESDVLCNDQNKTDTLSNDQTDTEVNSNDQNQPENEDSENVPLDKDNVEKEDEASNSNHGSEGFEVQQEQKGMDESESDMQMNEEQLESVDRKMQESNEGQCNPNQEESHDNVEKADSVNVADEDNVDTNDSIDNVEQANGVNVADEEKADSNDSTQQEKESVTNIHWEASSDNSDVEMGAESHGSNKQKYESQDIDSGRHFEIETSCEESDVMAQRKACQDFFGREIDLEMEGKTSKEVIDNDQSDEQRCDEGSKSPNKLEMIVRALKESVSEERQLRSESDESESKMEENESGSDDGSENKMEENESGSDDASESKMEDNDSRSNRSDSVLCISSSEDNSSSRYIKRDSVDAYDDSEDSASRDRGSSRMEEEEEERSDDEGTLKGSDSDGGQSEDSSSRHEELRLEMSDEDEGMRDSEVRGKANERDENDQALEDKANEEKEMWEKESEEREKEIGDDNEVDTEHDKDIESKKREGELIVKGIIDQLLKAVIPDDRESEDEREGNAGDMENAAVGDNMETIEKEDASRLEGKIGNEQEESAVDEEADISQRNDDEETSENRHPPKRKVNDDDDVVAEDNEDVADEDRRESVENKEEVDEAMKDDNREVNSLLEREENAEEVNPVVAAMNKRNLEIREDERAAGEPRRKKFKRPERSYFHPLNEHRPWCPWVTTAQPITLMDINSQSEASSHTSWQRLLKVLLPDRSPLRPNFGPNLKMTPPHESIRSIRRILTDWASPKLNEEHEN